MTIKEDELPDDPPAEESFEAAKPVEKKLNGSHQRKLEKKGRFEVNEEALHSATAEAEVLCACLIDEGATLGWALEQKLSRRMFFFRANGTIYETLVHIRERGQPVDLGVLFEALSNAGELDEVGGMKYLLAVSKVAATTAQAQLFVSQVIDLSRRRDLILAAEKLREDAALGADMGDLTSGLELTLRTLQYKAPNRSAEPRSFGGFIVPRPGDPSILLGNRYLNRGDGGVLVSTSGMGKSSMSLQMAATWALGRDFFGIKPNGPLKSLIVQAEDSDGDIAEVWASVRHGLALTAAEEKAVGGNVAVVTDRIHRGPAFFSYLKKLTLELKPDLVFINPLQSFMVGDLTEGRDLGSFLREGLNAINEPPSFGYIVVHHTTKPPTEKKDRQWNEVMYDMAGGAEIINWARFVMSLRANPENEGLFELVLAKRGRRAGVTKRIEAGLQTRDEVQTKIGLKHASGFCLANGIQIPLVFWEPADVKEKTHSPAGRPKNDFAQFADSFPSTPETAQPMAVLLRQAQQFKPVSKSSFYDILTNAVDDGFVVRSIVKNRPVFYRKLGP